MNRMFNKQKEEYTMDFSVNFMQKTTDVLTEVSKLKKYKAMPLPLAIITGVLMLPFAVVAFGLTVALYLLGYLFSVISMPTQKLHKLLKDEGQSVKHATQFVIYALTWAVVFGAYAALSGFMIALTILYTLFSIFTYICTLGGFKFHVFASDEDLCVETEGVYDVLIPVIFIAGIAVLLLLLPLVMTIGDVIKDNIATFDAAMTAFKGHVTGMFTWSCLFSAIYSLAVFAPNPKKKENQ